MNKEFIDALGHLAAERNIEPEQLLNNFEEALQQAFERNVEPGKEIEVNVDSDTGEIEVLIIKRVVEVVENEDTEIILEEALKLDDEIEVGMEMEFPVDPEKFTRIAVQTTKQVITQKIREAERQVVFEEYKDRVGEVITAVVARVDNKRNAFVDLGRGEAIMPPKEQIPGERYMVGSRLKVYIAKVELSTRGPSILVSRAAPELLNYLMRQEIPEVTDETVELKSIAREAGQRSKVAVHSNNPNVDPIGACIGHKGARIQAVTSELQRERVDIIMWDPNPREFIRNALSPAKVGIIEVNPEEMVAKVTVATDQLSLAIGKGGQNVRLAAKLTGYKVDLETGENVSDLDAAMHAAALDLDDLVTAKSEDSNARFDALFEAKAAAEATKKEEEESVSEAADDVFSAALAEADAPKETVENPFDAISAPLESDVEKEPEETAEEKSESEES